MGLEFKIVNTERKELDKVACDRCGRDIKKRTKGQWNIFGEPHSHYHEPSFEDFFLLNKSWGYDSGKDTETHSAVLCERCYDIVFEGVKLQITNYM